MKAIMVQFPVGAKIEIAECKTGNGNFTISITRHGYSINATAEVSITTIQLFGLITDLILEFNRTAPL